MSDTVAITIPRPQVKEGSSFTASVAVRAAGIASIPTNLYYRIDNLTNCQVKQDWTSVTAASTASISVTATHNALGSQCNTKETLQITIDADHGLSTQVRNFAQWEVQNVRGF